MGGGRRHGGVLRLQFQPPARIRRAQAGSAPASVNGSRAARERSGALGAGTGQRGAARRPGGLSTITWAARSRAWWVPRGTAGAQVVCRVEVGYEHVEGCARVVPHDHPGALDNLGVDAWGARQGERVCVCVCACVHVCGGVRACVWFAEGACAGACFVMHALAHDAHTACSGWVRRCTHAHGTCGIVCPAWTMSNAWMHSPTTTFAPHSRLAHPPPPLPTHEKPCSPTKGLLTHSRRARPAATFAHPQPPRSPTAALLAQPQPPRSPTKAASSKKYSMVARQKAANLWQGRPPHQRRS